LYLEKKGSKNKSSSPAEWFINRYCEPLFEMDANQVQNSDIRGILAGLTPSMQSSLKAHVSAIYTGAIHQGLLKDHPCHGIQGHQSTKRRRILQDSEVPKFGKNSDGVVLMA
jgi:hypothetical protein